MHLAPSPRPAAQLDRRPPAQVTDRRWLDLRFCRPSFEALTLLWTIVAAALTFNLGRYDLPLVLVVGAALPIYVAGPRWSGLFSWLGAPGERRRGVVLLLAAASLCAVTAAVGPLTDIRRFRSFLAWRGLSAVIAVGMMIAAVGLARGADPRRVVRWLWLAVILLVMQRALTVFLAPRPWIDAWTLQQEAADHLLAGRNPYAAHYTQIYPKSLFGYVSHFGYLPLVAVFDAAFRWLCDDVRFGYAACEGATAILLYGLARGDARSETSGLREVTAVGVALLYLAHPLGAFVVQECWSEPLLLTLVAATLFGQLHRRDGTASAPFWAGLMLAAKQSNVLLFPLTIASSPRRARDAAAAVGVAALITAPFAIWQPQAFFDATVRVFAHMPIRRDAFSLWTVLYREGGVQVPAAVTVALVLGAVGWSLRQAWRHELERSLTGVTLACWLLYMTGRQSFANYHFFVAGLLVMTLALRARQSLADDDRPPRRP